MTKTHRFRAFDSYFGIDETGTRGVFDEDNHGRIARRIGSEQKPRPIGERLGLKRRGNDLLELHVIQKCAIYVNANEAGRKGTLLQPES